MPLRPITVLAIAGLLLAAGAGSFKAWTGSDSQDRVVAATNLAAAIAADASSAGEGQEVDLIAAPTTANFQDGLSTDVWAYNGSVPGPELRVELGEMVVVNLENQLPQATSIHWRRVRVPNAMDGVPGVNQPPVEPGDSFRCEFTPKDAGTFWFHSHNRGSEQIERGLCGTLAVTDPNEPAYDQDLMWAIDDLLLDENGSLVEEFNTSHEISHNGRWGNTVITNGQVNPTVEALPGERTRIRMVNASNARVVAPEFEGLTPIVIAVDGIPEREATSGQGFVLAPGNRVDLDMTIPNVGKTIAVTENFSGEGFEVATIRVAGAAADTPTFDAPYNPSLPLSKAANFEIVHDYSLDFFVRPESLEWGFNGKTFDETENLSLGAGELSTIRLTNSSQAMHPIHFHGQFFQVISIDGDPVDEGFLRDTVLVLPGQAVNIAMVPVDVGTWVVYCHIQEHAEAGMMTLLDVGA